jgi:hypothetical protein
LGLAGRSRAPCVMWQGGLAGRGSGVDGNRDGQGGNTDGNAGGNTDGHAGGNGGGTRTATPTARQPRRRTGKWQQ